MAATYPPPNHVLSVMGIEVAWTGPEKVSGRAGVDWRLLGRGQAPPGVGALMAIVDLVAGVQAARTVDGDWLVTSDVGLYERAPITGGPIELESRLLRVGKRATLVGVEVTAGGEPAVSAIIEFARIRRDATAHSAGSPGKDGEWVRLGSGPLLNVPLEQACGFRLLGQSAGDETAGDQTAGDQGLSPLAAGTVEIDRSPFVNNSIGTLQGGVIALLADVSAAAAVGPEARTVDLHFRFLDQTKDGPARATAEILKTDATGSSVKVEIVDMSTGRLVGWANCRVE